MIRSGTLAMRRISIDAVHQAATHMYEAAVRTPLIRLDLPFADGEGPRVYLKLESLQPIGSFKLRGAWNAVRRLPPDALREGVWTVSAGNAAQGVAFAARRAGVPCSVMVMDTAPETKLRSIAALGASMVKVPYEEAWKTVESHASSRMPGRLVHPFDDDDFIAGNATLALEILEDLPEVDTIVTSIGGGGLIAGVAAVVKALRPDVRVIAAEPETAAPLAASLRAGEARYFEGWTASFVDGAGGKSVLPTMWPLLRESVHESIVMSLADIAAAMRYAADRVHVVAEGAAGCAIAAAMSGRAGRGTIVAVVSGGNIDLSRFAQLVGVTPRPS
jgi:threonine dehydratase